MQVFRTTQNWHSTTRFNAPDLHCADSNAASAQLRASPTGAAIVVAESVEDSYPASRVDQAHPDWVPRTVDGCFKSYWCVAI